MTLRIEIVKRASGPQPVSAPRFGPLVARRRTEAEEDATRIVDSARGIAERAVLDANRDADAIRSAAAAEGRAAAERAWCEQALDLSSSATAAVDRLESELVRLSIEVARSVVGASLGTDPSLVATLAERACRSLRRDASLVLRVSPANEDRISEIRTRLGERSHVVVELDDSLGVADCVAECAGVRVDATLEALLENVRRRLDGREVER